VKRCLVVSFLFLFMFTGRAHAVTQGEAYQICHTNGAAWVVATVAAWCNGANAGCSYRCVIWGTPQPSAYSCEALNQYGNYTGDCGSQSWSDSCLATSDILQASANQQSVSTVCDGGCTKTQVVGSCSLQGEWYVCSYEPSGAVCDGTGSPYPETGNVPEGCSMVDGVVVCDCVANPTAPFCNTPPPPPPVPPELVPPPVALAEPPPPPPAYVTLLPEIEDAGDWDGAADQCMLWNKAAGRVLPGLTRRRAAEAALMR